MGTTWQSPEQNSQVRPHDKGEILLKSFLSDLVRFWLFCKIKSGEITTETGPGKETYPPFVSPVINSFAHKLFEKYMAPSCHFELLRFFCFKVTFVSTFLSKFFLVHIPTVTLFCFLASCSCFTFTYCFPGLKYWKRKL